MQTPKTHILCSRSKVTFSLYEMGAIFDRMATILDFWVIMMSLRQTDVRTGILVEDLPEKVSSYVIICAWFNCKLFEIVPAAILELAHWRKTLAFLTGTGGLNIC